VLAAHLSIILLVGSVVILEHFIPFAVMPSLQFMTVSPWPKLPFSSTFLKLSFYPTLIFFFA
jgi:hypothetical protein